MFDSSQGHMLLAAGAWRGEAVLAFGRWGWSGAPCCAGLGCRCRAWPPQGPGRLSWAAGSLRRPPSSARCHSRSALLPGALDITYSCRTACLTSMYSFCTFPTASQEWCMLRIPCQRVRTA